MKSAIAFFSTLAALSFASAQTPTQKISFRPSGVETKDAVIFSRKDAVAKNYGGDLRFYAATWTWNNDNLGQGTFRSLIQFDMGLVPKGAEIVSAKLRLYHDTTGFTKGHSSLSASNAAWLLRVKQAWAESTVTWENQPATDTAGRAVLPQSSDSLKNYGVDVTAMVRGMLSDSIGNHGFLLRTIEEKPYNALVFASGDNDDVSYEPMLEVEFKEAPTALRAPGASSTIRVRIGKGGAAMKWGFGGGEYDARGGLVRP